MKSYSTPLHITLIILIATLVSCSTYERILATPQSTPLELGMIGDLDATVTSKEFQTMGIPQLDGKIRLTPVFKSFNDLDYNAYKKLRKQEALDFKVRYIDSLPNKPQYVRLELQDRVGFLTELNAEKNSELKEQILTNTEADIITRIDWVVSEMAIERIKAADAVFLGQNYQHIPRIIISKNNQLTEMLFSEGLVLSYEVSQFCWGLDSRNEPKLMAIVENGKPCAGALKHNGNKLKKEKNLFSY